jgi:electron transfer flavoprotein beta subunit
VESFEVAPPRAAGQTVKDDGDGANEIAEFLAAHKLI